MDGGCQGLAGVTVFHATWTLLGNVQRCDAIAFSQGGEIKNMVNKGVNIAVGQEPHLTDVDQLGRPFSDDLYTQQALALWVSDQLEEAVRNPGDLAACEFVKAGSAPEGSALEDAPLPAPGHDESPGVPAPWHMRLRLADQ